MPDTADHIREATKNEAVAKLLADAGQFDWAVIALFYAALHGIQAYFVQSGIMPASQRRRQAEIERRPELSPIEGSYGLLRVHSENARYECIDFSQSEYEQIESATYRSIVNQLATLVQAGTSTAEDNDGTVSKTWPGGLKIRCRRGVSCS